MATYRPIHVIVPRVRIVRRRVAHAFRVPRACRKDWQADNLDMLRAEVAECLGTHRGDWPLRAWPGPYITQAGPLLVSLYLYLSLSVVSGPSRRRSVD